MEEFQMDIHLSCPWCGGSEILVDHRTKATISVQCAKCREDIQSRSGLIKNRKSPKPRNVWDEEDRKADWP